MTRTELPLTSRTLLNPTAYIPPQCYTRTQDAQGRVHNPCYTCHTVSRRPNFSNDADLQLGYSFGDTARSNRWHNLFRDPSAAIRAIDDAQIRDYIRASNYFDESGAITLAKRLADVPRSWDYSGNGRWDGYVPDAWFDFDADGFDHDPAGTPTGWRAFAYYPFPGTFWPTNGSTDDVLIRLPQAFRADTAGKPSRAVYQINLAIVEAMLTEHDVAISATDEAGLGGVDLDKDGVIGTAHRIAYDWVPLEGRDMTYVGAARALQQQGELHLAAGLFPEGTEFLHTVRYIDVDANGNNLLAARMKEVRYARKRFWVDYAKLDYKASAEIKEKHDFPDRQKTVRGDMEHGVSNGQAWVYAGFIEDADGELRPQRYEELVFCVGCHGGIGANRDGIFSFSRKLDHEAFRQGWYHWTQRGLRGIAEPLRADGNSEYAYYLAVNGAGDELRDNDEVQARFFMPDGELDPAALRALRHDIASLLFASPRRALTLNKAYRVIVDEQSFAAGRTPTLRRSSNVHASVVPDEATGVTQPLSGY